MRILLIDAIASLLDFGLRAEAQGHECKLWLPKRKDGARDTIADGLLHKVENWQSWMKWADLIVTSDNAKVVPQLERYRREGYPIWGANVAVTAWELERGTGQEVLQKHGIPTLPSTVFSNYDEAIAFLQANPKRYVSKPTGDADRALSYVSKSADDMLFMLEKWKCSQKSKVPFLFQDFTPGIEVAVGGWVGKNGFSKFFLENFEFKKLMPGEIGVNTGEMGTVMKYCTVEESQLARELLLPLEAELIREGYTGYIDVAVIITNAGRVNPLEFTSRMGWPLFQIQQVLHPDVAQWMKDGLEGLDTFEPSQEVAVGIIMAMPDFPYGKTSPDLLQDFPVWGITDKNRYWVHPAEMKAGTAPVFKGGKLQRQPMLVSAGGYVLVVSGRAETVTCAIEEAYDHQKDLIIPNSPLYRNDIGKRLEKELPKLQAMGYCTSWSWD